VITGCVSGGDKADMYMLSMGRGQNISAVLTADNWDADLDLDLWNSSSPDVDSSAGIDSNESVSTSGTDADGAADTYYINVSQYSGLANYTLEIWTNGTIFIPPYDCGSPEDWGQPNADAGPSRVTAMQIGENPEESGMGCLDIEDTADAYGFSLSGMHGMTVELESHNNENMHLQLFDGSDDSLITEVYSTNGSAMVDTTGLDSSDLNGGYYVIINAYEAEGWYNLSFTPIDPPLPNLVASAINCPVSGRSTGEQVFFGADISSDDGPMDAAFAWQLSLVDENGTEVLTLLQDAYSDALDGNDGVIIQDGDLVLLDSATISSGNYTCVLTVDGGDVIVESNETDNTMTSPSFEIINYDELFANDLDRDGVLNDDDACPNTPGDSTMDRLGCQDADGDGYSNGGDVFIYEATQWNDTDGDGFGDNNGPSDYNGDVCPNEFGVMSGTNGTGCPLWIPDEDNDGVSDSNDMCQGTPSGAAVDAFGCSDTDGDGVDDTIDACPDTPADTSVDNTGCPVDDGTDDPGDTNGTDESGNNQSGDTESSSGDDSDMMLYIMIAAGIVLLLVVVLGLTLVLRSGGKGNDPTEQAWATAITPEQQAYEQQLIGMGYTAEQARAYASQYFQN
jgi:hypothetical protein